MDTFAPGGFTCLENDPTYYELTEMLHVMIIDYEFVEASFVRVICPCGSQHSLPIGMLVQEAEDLNARHHSEGCPPLDLMFEGAVSIPVWTDPDRPLSHQDTDKVESFSAELDLGDSLADFRLELDNDLDEETAQAAAAFWPDFWRWIYRA